MSVNRGITKYNIDYSALPEHIREGMRLYIEAGIEPGSFCRAVLENDLKGALGKADDINRANIFYIVSWVYNECPAIAQGSPEKVEAWLKRFRNTEMR